MDPYGSGQPLGIRAFLVFYPVLPVLSALIFEAAETSSLNGIGGNPDLHMQEVLAGGDFAHFICYLAL